MAELTLLNEPPLRSLATARHVLRVIRYRRGRQRLGGPVTVVTNLVLGLERARIPYRLNPGSRITEKVGVLSDPDTLSWAIARRRSGHIRRLVAGPNFPQPVFGKRILDDAVDLVVVASPWLRELFETQAPELSGRVRVWPVGIDETWWTPAPTPQAGDVLIYSKAHPEELLERAIEALEVAGLRWTVVRYGAHDRDRYRELLRAHRWALFLSESEGQGIALLEAWSCGVPTLVWDPGTWRLGGLTWDGASAAPYLTQATGVTFRAAGELAEAVRAMDVRRFAPREEVLRRFTAADCARAYARLFEP